MCWYWFLLNNFCREALILLKVCRRIYHCKIQVKFDISNYPQNFGWVMALFPLSFCWSVDIGVCSVTFAGMHWFYWKFAEQYIIVKYRSDLILVIIRKILAELWSFFNLLFVGVLILVSAQQLLQGCIDFIESLHLRIYHCKIQVKFELWLSYGPFLT